MEFVLSSDATYAPKTVSTLPRVIVKKKGTNLHVDVNIVAWHMVNSQ